MLCRNIYVVYVHMLQHSQDQPGQLDTGSQYCSSLYTLFHREAEQLSGAWFSALCHRKLILDQLLFTLQVPSPTLNVSARGKLAVADLRMHVHTEYPAHTAEVAAFVAFMTTDIQLIRCMPITAPSCLQSHVARYISATCHKWASALHQLGTMELPAWLPELEAPLAQGICQGQSVLYILYNGCVIAGIAGAQLSKGLHAPAIPAAQEPVQQRPRWGSKG